MQKTYKGKSAYYYVSRAVLALSENAIYELFLDDIIMYKSNYGKCVTLYAPGLHVELALGRKAAKLLDTLEDFRFRKNNQ